MKPILIELGNEFYLANMYDCKFGNYSGEIYGNLTKKYIPHVRRLIKNAVIAIVGYQGAITIGPSGEHEEAGILLWNEGLRWSGVLDMEGAPEAVTFHDYRLNNKRILAYGNNDVDKQKAKQAAGDNIQFEITRDYTSNLINWHLLTVHIHFYKV